jgi:NitT/TauT family transport system ATP-binding protein
MTAPNTPALAALIDVEVDYSGRRALGPFSLSLQPGEIVALVGPSGCGKSTALRLLAGLEAPTRGEVSRTPGRGETAVVFQAPTLMPWSSAAANVALPLELAGVPKTAARRRAREALTRVGLGDAAKLKPAQLSGGMAMRASLARALVTEPKLLLLDEPFAALDEITRRRLADDVLALWAETRTEAKPSIIFVTHNVEEAAYMAGRVVVMSAGPGRAAGETIIEAPLPRPAGFRATEVFRAAAEAVSADLDRGMVHGRPTRDAA